MYFNHSKAVEFWEWFQSIENQLSKNLSNSILIKRLDALVSEIGKFEWELGPQDEGGHYIAISPNLNKNLLTATQQIIQLAPTCTGWKFLPAKPAKKGELAFKMNNHRGVQITVDSSKWQYVLYQFEDNMFAIDIKTGEMDCNIDDAYLAVDIALTNILGEEEYMALICDVKVVEILEHADKATSFKYLDNHLLSLL